MSAATLLDGSSRRLATGQAAARVGVLRIDRGWRLWCGAKLDSCDVAYELCGPPDAPVVAVLGGISANRHVVSHALDATPGWWESVIGRAAGIDTGRFRLLSFDYLGGAGRSTGPHTRDDFPTVDTHDQANALAAVLDHLRLPRLHALVGASYGGMVGLAFAALHAQRVERLVAIGAAHRAHPMATALRAIQRDIVLLGIDTGEPARALALARALGVTTYRSAVEFAQRFEQRPAASQPGVRFPVQDYLDHCGGKFAATFPPACFLKLSESIDLHDVTPAHVRVPVTFVAVDSDSLAPPWQIRELAAAIGPAARVIEVQSIYGHDAFLKEVGAMSRILRQVLVSDVKGKGAA